MSTTVCLSANASGYPQGGGHWWVYLNWALGLRALGCQVIWLDAIRPTVPVDVARRNMLRMREYLERYGLADHIVAYYRPDEPLFPESSGAYLDLTDAFAADLLLNFRYGLPSSVVKGFRRSALVDIDPGLLQIWVASGTVQLAPHDVYFTTGETVGTPGARFPDAGLPWIYTPPCVATDRWQPHPAMPDAPFTSVSHWYANEWMQDNGEVYSNDKRSGFLPFLTLPRQTSHPLELALSLSNDAEDEKERNTLTGLGWRIRDAHAVAGTPWDYENYIRASRGEFSCAKPSCVRLQNAWISDRSLCYLASGKPVILQDTGPSTQLPPDSGFFRFRTLDEAVSHLDIVMSDYEHYSSLARKLAEDLFDAAKVAAILLERALK